MKWQNAFNGKKDEGAQVGLPDWSKEEKEHLGEELADVLLYLLRLADKCEIDLPKAAQAKIEKNGRKYPVQHVQGSSKKYTEYYVHNRKESVEGEEELLLHPVTRRESTDGLFEAFAEARHPHTHSHTRTEEKENFEGATEDEEEGEAERIGQIVVEEGEQLETLHFS